MAETPTQATSVILISVDTLRADHLSCYGYRRVVTPNIDLLAKRGTLFQAINSQVPLTLPSHTSLLLSEYPFSTGIEDNGESLGKGAVTLATVLKSHGYRTAAFIGGFVLDRRFGLNQGFDFYDSPFNLSGLKGAQFEEIKRPSAEVIRSASQWLRKNPTGPFFAFIHLYDLHTPYLTPPGMRKMPGETGYDSELTYVDDALGRFWAFLREKGLFKNTLIVFLSDHGEGLGQHGERTHGYFIYQSTLWVPLIIHWPSSFQSFPAQATDPAGLIDVAPTILEILGIQRPPQFQGKPFIETVGKRVVRLPRDRPPEAVYSESLYAHLHFGCSGLECLRLGHYKYIEAPKPELYDLALDSGERRNLYKGHRALAMALRERMLSLRSSMAKSAPKESPTIDPAVLARLKSLGYAAFVPAHHSVSFNTGADPKDRLADYNRYRRAVVLALNRRFVESDALLENLLAKEPNLSWVRNLLGENEQQEGEYGKAAQNFRTIAEKDPLNVLAHFNLGMTYYRLEQVDKTMKELEVVLAIASRSGGADQQVAIPAEELLGEIWIRKGDYSRAQSQFTHLLQIAPTDYLALYNLGWLASHEGRFGDAIGYLKGAVKAEPNSAEAHNALGGIYLQQGSLNPAKDEFLQAIRLKPKYAWAEYNLGQVYEREGMRDNAIRAFTSSLTADPQFSLAKQALQRLSHEQAK